MNIKNKLVLSALALGLLSTQSVGTDLKYQCKELKNPVSCVSIIVDEGMHKVMRSTKKPQKAFAYANEYFLKANKYCKTEGFSLFSSNKKNKKRLGQACQYTWAWYVGMIHFLSQDKGASNAFLFKDLIKTAKTGCELDNTQSCLFLFEVYHPKKEIWTTASTGYMKYYPKEYIQKHLTPNLNKAVEYYKKACSKDGSAKNRYSNSPVEWADAKCRYNDDYLED